MLVSVLLAALVAASAPAPVALHEEPVTVTVKDGSISGTLTTPAGVAHRVPVALIIAGSGPTDRNGNAPGVRSDAYEKLASALGARGIATLRYDKRDIGSSTVRQSERDLRFDDYVQDAEALADMLAADKRFSTVVVIGHSEGSLIGILAAQRDPRIRAFVSLEGAGRPLGTILDEQVKASGAPEDIVKEVQQIDASLAAGKRWPTPIQNWRCSFVRACSRI